MNVVRGILPITLVISMLMFPSCSPKASDSIVLEVGSMKVSLGEYENFFSRNSGGVDSARNSTPAEREHFLDLLTNYKLKLQDAYDRNLMNDPELVNELREYRASLASTFMLDRELSVPGVQELYKRRQSNIRAQHILLSVKPDALPEDTLKAYAKAMEIIRRVKSGESFDSLAMQFSEDPSVKINHGDLYYFTGGEMVKPFEDAAYALAKKEVSPVPVRSTFGYHIIKIVDSEPSRSLRVRHIMAQFKNPSAPDSTDSTNTLERIKGMQDSLKKGWDFGKLAVKFSEDAGSAPNGGDLGWFERRRWIQPFDEASFSLKPGQTSGIIRTRFGFHIIRCDSERAVWPLSVIHDDIKKIYQQRRYADDYAQYMNALKKEVHYTFHTDAFDAFFSYLDSTKTIEDSAWDGNVTSDVRKMAVMSVNNLPISVDTVIAIIPKRPEFRNTPLRKNELKKVIERIGDTFLFEAKSAGLETRYPEFASLMKEYSDGVILYKAEQMEVWNKTTVSDTALKTFFAANRDKFKFPERVNINEIYLESDTVALMVYDSVTQGVNFTALASRWNDDTNLKAKSGARGMLSVETDEVTRHAATLKAGNTSEPVPLENGGFAIINLVAKEPAREKSYDEAGAEISNLYQEHMSKQLEQEWLDRVRLRHPVKQYKEHLREAFVK
jgi:peptidyl-prolyl cis-trans isomerase SurA